MNIELLKYIVILIFLAVFTLYDIKNMQIPIIYVLLFALSVIGICIADSDYNAVDIIVRVLPGVFLLLISFVTSQAVGYGDGLVMVLIGLLLDINMVTSLLLTALILSSVVSVLALISKKANRQTRLPFMPFLLIAWLIVLV